MDLPRRGPLALALAALAAAAAPAAADPGMCRVINLDFTPSGIAAGTRVPPGGGAALASPELAPQIVAWIEKSTGEYVDTVFITEQTGRYGLGNRPGRYDFNSALRWPYGRRITTFPVWAHRHGKTFTQLEFQSGQDSDLSHRFDQSSRELHYCRPIATTEKPMWDAVSCASTVYTDKGVFGATPSLYPPRVDITATPGTDSGSVAMFKAMNPFDAVSQATPAINQAAQVSWPIPYTLPMGSYVMVMEVSLEQDFNAVYSVDAFPAPIGIPYGTYGVPYRGQPSVLYRVPFQIAATETFASTDAYAGYGDVAGGGAVHDPDATITTDTPGSGAQRLLMMSKDGQSFRLRVDARPEPDTVAPGAPGVVAATGVRASTATIAFAAPGDDGALGTVQGYEVRYRVGAEPLSAADFEQASAATFTGKIAAAGEVQELALSGLLPETTYTIAVRAFDDCHNTGPLAQAVVTTAARTAGEVDACFVATAAYGSVLANDVELLRHVRDSLLRRSVLGELFVETYYTFGPPVAGVVGESELLRATARTLLEPVVGQVRGLRR